MDLNRLDGQVALVTGASSGIGRASALALARAGAAVVIDHRAKSAVAAAELRQEIEAEGGTALCVEADVSREHDVEAMFQQVVDRFGTVHILCNNAGIQDGAPFAELALEQWRRVLEINLGGQFLCARAAVREFRRRGPQPEVSRATGKIICMSSVHQAIPWAFEANYAASKGGILLMMKSLAQEVACEQIRVNAIAPGAIQTRINREAWDTEEARQDLLELIPYGRVGEPEDVARAVVWLASDASDYVTGTTLFIDGGMALYPGFRGEG